ncbi:MAG TPA: T9SS type A sorting domain-containing protein, partial [Bacteroidales bacterium]|nr:T9SS type A sorting domain-containing protein [Bacteroidales bacterium]
IYRAEGWGDYVLWRNNMPALSDTMTAIAGTSYKFFCQAVDNLGNEEPYKGFPEKVLGIKDGGTSGVSFKIIPNPAYSNAIIRFQILRPVELQIEILSNNGQVVYRSEKMKHDPGKQDHRVNISGFAPGVYMVVIKTEEGVSAEKLVIGKE